MNPEPRRILPDELDKLIELYGFLHPSDEIPDRYILQKSWYEIMENSHRFVYFVIEEDDKIVSSCNITIVPNLTRGSRSYALIENVITHPDYRRKGLGQKVMEAAIHHARKCGCYKIMLMSSSERDEAHSFYEKIGFSGKNKKAFVLKF
jgi:GNAT superfamily N-acetyltransferase